MRQQQIARAAVIGTILITTAVPSDAQVQSGIPNVPPAGYPHRTIRQTPGVQVGPPTGIVAPGASTLPSNSLPPTIDRVPGVGRTRTPRTMTPSGDTTTSYRYWSPSIAASSVQERLRKLAPLTIGEQALVPGTVPQGTALPQDYGLSGSQTGLDPLAPYRRANQLAVPPVARGAAPATAEPAGDHGQRSELSELQIPFDQFETYEEFRTWIEEQLGPPELPADPSRRSQERSQTGRFPGASPQQQRRQAAEARYPEERPIIGYVGRGSNARTPITGLQGGGDLAYQSAELVAELNEYLRQTRDASRARAGARRAGPGGGVPALPPPRSSLGRQRGYDQSRPLPSQAPGVGGFAPQPRQYWQNLGGYRTPTGPGEWLPPDAGY